MSRKKRRRIVQPAAGYEGRFEQGVLIVDDPYDKARKVTAQANIRHDLLIHWRARRAIDDAQYIAGQRLQGLWYRARIGAPSAIQYDKDKVDVSAPTDPIADRIIAAANELREIAGYLGKADYKLVTALVCDGQQISDFAARKVEREYVARRVRDALGYLAAHWGAVGLACCRIRVDRHIEAVPPQNKQ